MGVISIRRDLMPGFTELAADMDLAALLGTEPFGMLLRLCQLAAPAADVPGSWVVNYSQADLAKHLGYSTNKTSKLLLLLCDAGVLAHEPGMRLGRGLGTTNGRYFITAIPGMPAPAPRPNPRGPKPARDDRKHEATVLTSLPNTALHSSGLKTSVLKEVRPQPPAASQERHYNVTNGGLVSDLTDEYSSQDNNPESSNSPLLAAALARINWDGPLPLVSDPALVAVVATWLAGQQHLANKAGYLNKLIANGDLESFAATRGIAVPKTRPANSMTSAEFVEAKRRYPDWADQVTEAATQVAASRGAPVRMSVLCEVAATIPLPVNTQAQAEGEGS